MGKVSVKLCHQIEQRTNLRAPGSVIRWPVSPLKVLYLTKLLADELVWTGVQDVVFS